MDTAQDMALTTWWQQFDDPRLEQLLLLGRTNNPTLQSAALHIVQAQAQLGISAAASRPTVALNVDESHSNPDLIHQLKGTDGSSTSSQVSMTSSWQPDLWGAIRRGQAADRDSWLATAAGYEATMTALEANIASTYFSIRTLQVRLAVAHNNLLQQQENLRIAKQRYLAGETSEQDLRQAEVLYNQTHATLPALTASLQQAEHGLSVMLGQTPDFYQQHFSSDSALPRMPSHVPASIPHDLLRRRPDVLQAEYSAMAQSERIGQAKAALFPSFTLSGSFGFQSSNSRGDHLFSWQQPVTSLSGGFLLPLFNRGQLVNQVRVQDAEFEQAVLGYQNQVLLAQQQVEDALSAIEGQRHTLQDQIQAAQAAERSTELAIERYKAGESDFTTVTAVYQTQLQVEDAVAQNQGSLLQSYVAVYQALGGGWDGKLTAYLPAERQRTMQARTDWGDALALPNNRTLHP